MAAASMIPSIWREELFHPLTVHFPVALIPTAALFILASVLLSKNEKFNFLRPSFSVLIFMSYVSLFIAFQTGEIAEDVVNRVICDPEVTKKHADLAKIVMSLVGISFLLEMISLWIKRSRKFLHQKKLDIVLSILLIIAVGVLMKVGHLGAELTYQQGAGTYKPTPECTEFE